MEKAWFHYIIDILLLIAFVLLGITGIIKFPGLLRSFGLHYTQLPLKEISFIHDWSGISLVVLVIIHLILHWGFISSMTKKLFKKN